MPTEDQLASRQEVESFLSRVGRPIKEKLSSIKSEWFGRPTQELQGWIERGRWINEIEGSMGYKLIMRATDQEIEWARAALEAGTLDVTEIRMYLRALRFLKEFVLTTQKNADISSKVLSGRVEAIDRDTVQFIKNARVEK